MKWEPSIVSICQEIEQWSPMSATKGEFGSAFWKSA